jgi:hypothetical protein
MYGSVILSTIGLDVLIWLTQQLVLFNGATRTVEIDVLVCHNQCFPRRSSRSAPSTELGLGRTRQGLNV